jgi:23S rRNA pseudouridine955/2504/2580 synthase
MKRSHRMGRAGARSNDASDPRRGGKPGKSGERPGKSSHAGKHEKFGKKPFGKASRHADADQRPQGRHRQDSRAAPFHKDYDERSERRPPRALPAPVVEARTPPPQVSSGVQTVTVSADESGMRLDRFFAARFPGLSFSHIQRIVRKGEVRVNGKRADTKDRLEVGQQVRIPPSSSARRSSRRGFPARTRRPVLS